MKLTPLYLLSVLLLGGCAAMVKPNAQQAAAADYGAYPSNYRALVDQWIHTTFFDPYSIRDLAVSEPKKGWIQEPPLLGGKTYYGYDVLVTLNGKNQLGAYVGLRSINLLIRNGTVIAQ